MPISALKPKPLDTNKDLRTEHLTEEDLRSIRKRMFADYIKNCRGMTDDLPKGILSRHDIARQTGISVASIRAYEMGSTDPLLIESSAIAALAALQDWSSKEFMAYFRGQDMTHQLKLEDVLASVRWRLEPEELVKVLGEIQQRLQRTFDPTPEETHLYSIQNNSTLAHGNHGSAREVIHERRSLCSLSQGIRS